RPLYRRISVQVQQPPRTRDLCRRRDRSRDKGRATLQESYRGVCRVFVLAAEVRRPFLRGLLGDISAFGSGGAAINFPRRESNSLLLVTTLRTLPFESRSISSWSIASHTSLE